ncbi:hypothetical protein ACFLUJ_04590 [Chloroflexota bacterium]
MKIFPFILLAMLVSGLVSCTQPNNGLTEAVTIETDRNSYIATISSTVGIGLIPAQIIGKSSETVKFHWHTNYGYFIAWDPPDFKVNLLGTEVINNGENIYWSYDPSEMGIEKPSVTITLQIEDGQTEQVLGETNLKIGWKDRDTAILVNH